jgi:hypothetical protein
MTFTRTFASGLRRSIVLIGGIILVGQSVLAGWDGKGKTGSLFRAASCIDLSTVRLNDPASDGES